jgi:hypothetical protein
MQCPAGWTGRAFLRHFPGAEKRRRKSVGNHGQLSDFTVGGGKTVREINILALINGGHHKLCLVNVNSPVNE